MKVQMIKLGIHDKTVKGSLIHFNVTGSLDLN